MEKMAWRFDSRVWRVVGIVVGERVVREERARRRSWGNGVEEAFWRMWRGRDASDGRGIGAIAM
jgi:hypothetical protein